MVRKSQPTARNTNVSRLLLTALLRHLSGAPALLVDGILGFQASPTTSRHEATGLFSAGMKSDMEAGGLSERFIFSAQCIIGEDSI